MLQIDVNAACRETPTVTCYFWVEIIFRDWKGYQSRKIKKLLFYVSFCLPGLQLAPVLSAGEQGRRRHVPLADLFEGFCLPGLQLAPVLSAGEQGRRRHVPLAALFEGFSLSGLQLAPARAAGGPSPAQGGQLPGNVGARKILELLEPQIHLQSLSVPLSHAQCFPFFNFKKRLQYRIFNSLSTAQHARNPCFWS